MVTMGYGGGGYASPEGCNCADGSGGTIMSAPMNAAPQGTVVPVPMGDQIN